MKNYFRVMLGRKSTLAAECFAENYIGVGFSISEDLTGKLADDWRDAKLVLGSTYLKTSPGKSKIAAGLACSVVWTVCKGMQNGDVVLCPDGNGFYHVGEIIGDYTYVAGAILPHRRPVKWLGHAVSREEMSEALRKSVVTIGTLKDVSKYREEIEKLVGGALMPILISTDQTVEDPSAFALESHLQEFLVQNWAQTELGKEYDIFEEDGELVGDQYPADNGRLDILAIRKDKKELLVVELKKGRASDVVVGQILRYMGYVLQELTEEGQTVKGAIIALEDDQRIRRALAMTPSITFYRYQVSFKLVKA